MAGAQPKPGGVAVAADTSVVDEDQILGKPANPRQAADMLWQLRGRVHRVLSAIAVIRAGDDAPLVDLCSTEVPMREYSDEEIFAYIQSGDPFDKAGGYAIQNPGFNPVATMAGCYANVVGLPICHLVRVLRRLNLPGGKNAPAACQRRFDYDCPVHDRILSGED